MAPPSAMTFLKRGLLGFVNEAKVFSMRRKQAAKKEELRKKQHEETRARLRRVETHNLRHVSAWGIVCITTEHGCFKQYWRAPITLGQHIDELPEGLKAHQEELRRRGYSRCSYATCGVEKGDHVMEVEIPDNNTEPEEDFDDEMDVDGPLGTSNVQSLPEEMEGFEPHTTIVLSTPSLTSFIPTQTVTPPKPANTLTHLPTPSTGFDTSSTVAETLSKPPTNLDRRTIMMPPPAKKPGTFMKGLPPSIVKPAGGHANAVQTTPVEAVTPIPTETTLRTAQEQTEAGVQDATVPTLSIISNPSIISTYDAAPPALPMSTNTITSSKAASQCTTPTKERKDVSSVSTSTPHLSSSVSSFTFSCPMPLQSLKKEDRLLSEPQQQVKTAIMAPELSTPTTPAAIKDMIITIAPVRKSGTFLRRANNTLPRNAQMEEHTKMADVNIVVPAPEKTITQDVVMSMSSSPSISEALRSSDDNSSRIAQSQPTSRKRPAIKATKIVLRVGWQPKSWDRNTDEPEGAATWNRAHQAPAEWRKPSESIAAGDVEESEYLEDLDRAKELLEGGENFEKSTREVKELFEEVYELCKARDQFVDTSNRRLTEVESVDKLSSQGLGSYVSVFQPRRPNGLSEQKRDLFEDDLITIQKQDPKLWEHLIGALLQRNCTLEQLLVDILENDGQIDKDWDVFKSVLETKQKLDWGINWRRVDDISAKIRYGVSQDTEDFYTATTLKGSSRKDFNIIVDMVTSKGYFYTFADQVKQWAVTRQAEFLRIVRRAGFVNPHELDEMTNMVRQIGVMCMDEHELWEKNMLACVAARYPQWYDRCGDH